jgi:hypothetical protein
MADPLNDPRLDELLRLGDRIDRIYALSKKVSPIHPIDDVDDRLSLHRIGWALRSKFWTLARNIAAELPQ